MGTTTLHTVILLCITKLNKKVLIINLLFNLIFNVNSLRSCPLVILVHISPKDQWEWWVCKCVCQEQVDRLLCSGLWCRLLNFTDPSTKTFCLMWTRQQCGIFISAAYHLWTSRPSCAAGGPPLSPRPSNGSDFYYLGWWDVHKEMVCQQDGKCISLPVLVWLF